ncbi:ATP-binding domain-containing protein [Deinococcus sp. HMF7604]|uniref:DEAD/DEAH box helicase n=1 Tax=Deinococcus betulae TaxID=2873312 RepID=UPI001CCAFA01|nr:nuclease-related domain-containing DEAD/DEAH box helicase [Deinococcus betulae]MBZ9749743.1 ATP-binding domain-containing protein [Deinococcus betulae]
MAEFLQTEAFKFAGEQGEQRVFEAVKVAFQDREAFGWWRYPLVSDTTVREPDILMIDPELGVIVIEVKSLPLADLAGVSGYRWRLQRPYFGKTEINPYEQVKAQLQVIMRTLRGRPGLDRVPGRVIVATPLITRDEWDDAPFNTLIGDTPLLHGDQLTPARLMKALDRTPLVAQGQPLNDAQWLALQRAFSTSGNIPKPKEEPVVAAPQSRSALVQAVRAAERPLDLQQERIAKTVPPGPQRIRGLAGSGKTVLLAQKAANMHLKHPDWDIALVFFSRSLYDQITGQVDHWLRLHSGGDTRLADAKHKLRILHAWGSRDQPGFYRVLADHAGIRPLTVTETPYGYQAAKNLIYCAHDLLHKTEEGQANLEFFDAILIDEGQDLVTEAPELRYAERQAFYWLAHRALRPVAAEPTLFELASPAPALKRLIWAYDEAQSLDSLMIPNTRTLFGDSWQDVFGSGAAYKGGIGKSEVMRVSYRTPGPILVAAHALGMGLLRAGGMLSGPTRKEDWDRLGYEVQGRFNSKEPVTLHRPAANSPHPLHMLTGEPLVTFESHLDREAEVAALVRHIQRDLHEGLIHSRQILVITVGRWAVDVQGAAAGALRRADIPYYVPAASGVNQQGDNKEPNRFWHDGAVTVTTVHRAKGNEADAVYVLGLDQVGLDEQDLAVRNQLFTAMSRSRGWLHLSGAGMAGTPFEQEVQAVLMSGDTLRFVPHVPRRRMDDEDLYA